MHDGRITQFIATEFLGAFRSYILPAQRVLMRVTLARQEMTHVILVGGQEQETLDRFTSLTPSNSPMSQNFNRRSARFVLSKTEILGLEIKQNQ